MQLTTEQRVFIVKEFNLSKSYKEVQNAFQQQFPNRTSPSKSTIWENVVKYQTEGTSLNLNKGRSGRKRSMRSAENIELVRHGLEDNPRISCRKNGLGIDRNTFHRIVKNDLKWHPYKIHLRHQLLPNDHLRRRNFCTWFLDRPARFINTIVVGDEAAFYINGKVNNHNVRQYAPRNEPPEFNFDVSMCREKVSVWIGMCGNGALIGPIFYEGNLTGEGYLNMLNERIIPELNRIHGNRLNRQWWIQDGAPCHRTINVRNRLREVFQDRIVSINHAIEWPPRSPDLTPCDFFLWGHLKSKVHITPPANIDELKQRISDEVDSLKEDPQLVRRVMMAMRKRIQLCSARNGEHVEGVVAH